jgi:hypothetical protein
VDDLAKLEDATNDLSRATNQQILNATPEGEELGSAITNWSTGGNEAHRRGATKWLSGSDDFIGVAEQQGAKLAEAVSVSPPVNVPTQRGFIFEGKSIDQLEDIYKMGAKTDIQISSFSTDPEIAFKFSGRGLVERGNTSVILHLEEGAKGLNVSPISTYLSEKERIFHGRFEVLKIERTSTDKFFAQYVEQTLGPAGQGEILNVHIRQIANFVKEAR